jgi:hypothetical protein
LVCSSLTSSSKSFCYNAPRTLPVLKKLPLGNGQQIEIEPDSESDLDAEADEDEENDPTTTDWKLLHFLWREKDKASMAVLGGNEQRLCAQRLDQAWVAELLPTRHHADPGNHTMDTRLGGMYGDLGIILGLIALSLHPDDVDSVLKTCPRAVRERSSKPGEGGWKEHNRASQRVDRRGVVVNIWSWPRVSTSEELQALENGEYGLIYE